MSAKLVVGLDGHSSGERALAYAQNLAGMIGDCKLILVYVVEWSPFSFQTPEENAERHKRREEEISTAMERIVDPALEKLRNDKVDVDGMVKHGDVADTLNRIAKEQGASQIIVARTSESGLVKRFFGSSTSNLVMSASVPVTVVN